MAEPQRSRVTLAVGGGIAAFKAATICSRLVQSGVDLRVAMTDAATQFIGVSTFAALSGKPVATGSFDPDRWPLGPHIELVEGADLMIVAPATAGLIGQFAQGLAADLVSTLYLQADCRVLLAPAMSQKMWSKPAVKRNIETLRSDGCLFIGPDEGWLSCRQQGSGRMSEPEAIVETALKLLKIDPTAR